jgi:NTE family protein
MQLHEYVNLVIEGGGVLGVAHVGALNELSERGILKQIRNFAGSSAGAIIAGALSVNATPKFLNKTMRDLNFNDFLDYGNKIVAVYNVLYYKGASRGDYFTKWYSDIIGGLTGDPNITLINTYKLYKKKVTIAVVNVTKGHLEYIDYKSNPNWPLALLVRASMSIPGIFAPVEIDGDLYIDGGTLDNYPIRAFHYQTDAGDVINPRTLGLMLVSTAEIVKPRANVDTLLQYAIAILDCVWTQPQKLYLDEQDWRRTIKIPTGELSSINFSLTRDEAKTLIAAGKKATSDYLDGVKSTGGSSMKKAFYTRVGVCHDVEDEIDNGGDVSPVSPPHSPVSSTTLTLPRTLGTTQGNDWNEVVTELIKNKF